MKTLRVLLSTMLLAAFAAGTALAQEIDVRAPGELSGRDAASGLRFSAATLGASLEIFDLSGDGRQITAVVGIDRQLFRLESDRDGTDGPTRLTPGDRAALPRIARLLDGGRPLEGTFLRVLNLLESWPPGLPLQASLRNGTVTTSAGTFRLPEGEEAEDLCGKMNRSHGGGYPVFGIPRNFNDLGIVGPYPWADGDCLGRCGAACPGDGPPNNVVFAFWQDCFDHDACVRDQGLTDPDCDLIFLATFDDFLYGASCQKDNADIVINGQDGPVDLNAGDPIEIRVSLTNVPEGTPVDYWLYARTPAGTFWFDLGAGSWAPGPPPAVGFQGPLRNVVDYLVYDGPLPAGFPSGTSTFYLSVDRVQDGQFEPRQFEDAVDVTVN